MDASGRIFFAMRSMSATPGRCGARAEHVREMIQRCSLTGTCLKICKTNKTWETTEGREGERKRKSSNRNQTEHKRADDYR